MIKRFHGELALFASSFGIDISVLTKEWMAIYKSRLQSRGKKDAVKFCKELNTVCERYALMQEITPIPWTKSDKDGFPRILRSFKSYLRSDDDRKVVMALSVMRSCESLRLPISKDISTVVLPTSSKPELVKQISDFIPSWVSRIKRVTLKDMKYHYTVKNGPNGPALLASDSDISAVMNDDRLLGAIQAVELKLGKTRRMDCKVVVKPQAIHSKLTQISEKAGKTRTIAIVDYYSQRCLKPLHESLMTLLSSLVSDGTYSHQNVGKFARQKTKEKSFIFCADLTAFTDRFPAEIQRVLLFELLKDDELSQALWTLLAERTFTVAWSGEQVTYQCGQPMGAYASWPLCSLAHHLLVEYAGDLVGKPAKFQYKLIGDDVIITEPEIAQKYKELITALGVEINFSKTVLSPVNANYSGAEVAKQLFLNGRVFTPLTPGFVRNLKKPYMFNTCIEVLRDRYEWFVPEDPPRLISKFFSKKNQKLVWLLCSNPVNGSIKPGNPGYDDNCPWNSEESETKRWLYSKMLALDLGDKAQKMVDQELDRFFSGESLWKDKTQPPPKALVHVKYYIDQELTQALNRLGDISVHDRLEDLVAEFDFIPDPASPYMDRKETRQRRISSSIEKLFSYNDSEEFITLDW